MKSKLFLCPFCNSNNVRRAGQRIDSQKLAGWLFIECCDCLARGPSVLGHNKAHQAAATKAWNKRSRVTR